MKRFKSKGKPGRSFGKSAMKTHRFNFPTLGMRGGIRL